MTTTNADDILSDVKLVDLDHREAQFVRAELIEKIDATIAAAVAAEREACAKVAEQAHLDSRPLIAAAIRERGGLPSV